MVKLLLLELFKSRWRKYDNPTKVEIPDKS